MPVSQEDLKLGYIALRREMINFPELKQCLEMLGRADEAVSLGPVLVHQGYLTRADHNYLQMLRKKTRDDPSDYPLLHRDEKLTLSAIYREYLTNFTSLKKGGTFGKFRILDLIGKGGMGVVLLAEEQGCEEPIALKILSGGPKEIGRAHV